MSDLKQLLREYIHDETPGSVEPFEAVLPDAPEPRSSWRSCWSGPWLVAATVSVVTIGVMSFAVVREAVQEDQAVTTASPVDITQLPTSLLGSWLLVEVDGEPYPEEVPLDEIPRVTFQPDGQFSSFDGCNRGSGTYTVDSSELFQQHTGDDRCWVLEERGNALRR